MAIISFNALSSFKLEKRLEVLTENGIINKSHEVRVRLPAEGKKPSLLPKNWEWIDWGCHLRGERHIRLAAEGMLDLEADYTIFCDDDSLTNIDHMVRVLDSQNDRVTPTIWLGEPGRMFQKNWEHSFKEYVGHLMLEKELSSMFLGYEISTINKPLAKLLNGSEQAKRILKYCDFLDKKITGVYSTPDLQISMASWLFGAKQIIKSESRCQQWPNFFNYSGINPDGNLWHIHWIDHGKFVKLQDVKSVLKICPTYDFESVFSKLFFSVKKGFKARNLFGRKFRTGEYHHYWHAGELDAYPSTMPPIIINSNGTIAIEIGHSDQTAEWGKWESINDGMSIQTPTYKAFLKWTHGDMFVGYGVNCDSKSGMFTIALFPVK